VFEDWSKTVWLMIILKLFKLVLNVQLLSGQLWINYLVSLDIKKIVRFTKILQKLHVNNVTTQDFPLSYNWPIKLIIVSNKLIPKIVKWFSVQLLKLKMSNVRPVYQDTIYPPIKLNSKEQFVFLLWWYKIVCLTMSMALVISPQLSSVLNVTLDFTFLHMDSIVWRELQ
jgi:hypothetical protein